MIDSFGDGWNGASLEVSIPDLGVSLGTFSLEEGYHQTVSFGLECETQVVETEGCTDPYAFNYDPYATIDDGSCSYDSECEDIYDPVCGYDWLTGEYVTYNNECEAGCAQAYICGKATGRFTDARRGMIRDPDATMTTDRASFRHVATTSRRCVNGNDSLVTSGSTTPCTGP